MPKMAFCQVYALAEVPECSCWLSKMKEAARRAEESVRAFGEEFADKEERVSLYAAGSPSHLQLVCTPAIP